MKLKKFSFQGNEYNIHYHHHPQEWHAEVEGKSLQASLQETINENTLLISYQDKKLTSYFSVIENTVYVMVNGEQYVFENIEKKHSNTAFRSDTSTEIDHHINAPMPGKILKIFVSEGQEINKNEPLFIVEAMKMENEIKSPGEGVVKKIYYHENEVVTVGEPIIELEFKS